MLQGVHERKISLPIDVAVGTNILIAGATDSWILVHELIGSLDAAGSLDVYAGIRLLAHFEDLADQQGVTLNDEPGEDGRPRFECRPGEDFRIITTGGGFSGSCHYSRNY